jgi:hypothetical protein
LGMKRVVLLIAMSLAAMAEPNFAGNWILNVSKSQYGQFPAPEVMTRSVQMQPSQILMSTYQKGAQGEVTTQLSYSTDGKPSKNGTSSGIAKWDGDTLVIESARDSQGTKLMQREVWLLSPEGKTLTIQSHIKLPNGDLDVKQVFEKAPTAVGARAAF